MVESIKDTASGSNLDRPGIERVRQLLSQGFVDVVLAYAVDRLSRNQIHIAVLLDDIEKVGATLEFVTEDFENTPVGRLILNVRAFAGEVERKKIAERTMRGKLERARAGKLPQGTGKGIYGYRYDVKAGRRGVVDEQADTVRTIFEQFVTSASCSRIAKELNDKGVPAFSGGIWHPLTVRRILQNETYTGRTVYRRTRVEKRRDLRNGRNGRHVRPQPETEWIDVPGATPALIRQRLLSERRPFLTTPYDAFAVSPRQTIGSVVTSGV